VVAKRFMTRYESAGRLILFFLQNSVYLMYVNKRSELYLGHYLKRSYDVIQACYDVI